MHLEPDALSTRVASCADTFRSLAAGGWWPAEHALATARRLERLAADLDSVAPAAGDDER